MRQEAIVVEGGEQAKVLVMRASACTGDCSTCSSCSERRPLYIYALNRAGAEKGDKVELETKTGTVLGAAALVYGLPVAVLIAVYMALGGTAFSELIKIMISAAAMAASFAAAYIYNKKLSKRNFCAITCIVGAR